jgi:hypothetical protein
MANEQTIANLIVKLSAQTVELASGLKKAEGSISSFVSGAQKIIGGLTIGTALYKLQGAIMGVVDRAADLSKLSEKLGVPMKEFAALASAADDLGLSVESMGIGIKFLSRNMQEATQGGGAAQEVFKALNVQFESTPGVLLPTRDVILSLADTFSSMEDGATKTALAVKLFGRSGVDMIPFLNKGRAAIEEMIASNERMGAVMSSETGQKARQFKLTLNEIKDATNGLTIAFASALLPTMQTLASAMQTTAESVNTLRLSMQAIVDFVKSGVVLVGITLFVKWTAAIGAFIATSGGLIAVIEGIGAAVSAAFIANPATAWIALMAAALYSAYLVWKSYPPEVDKAAEAHKRFTDEIKKMKPEEQKQKIDVYNAAIADMRHEIENVKATMEAQRSFGDTFGVEESKKKIDEMIIKLNEYRFYLGLLKITAAKGIATPVIADPGVIDTLKKKMIELKASFADFGPPMEKSRAAFKATLDTIVEGKGPIELYKKEIDSLIAKHNEYIATETKLKVYAANVAGDLQKAVSHWDSYLNDLEIDYSNGLVSLDAYFEGRRKVISEKTQAEITALQKERAMATTSPERKVAIGIEIQVKGEQLAAALKKETDAGEKAAKALADSIRVGELQSLIDMNSFDLVTLENQFSGGLVMIGNFYDKRRAIIQAEAEKKITNIAVTLPGLDPGAAEKARQEIASIRAQAGIDLLSMDNDQRAADAKLVSDTISTTAMLAQVKAAGAADGYEAMRLQGEASLELLKQRELDEIAQLNAFLGQKSDAEMSFNEKRQAMEDLYADQDRRRKQTTVDIERQIDQTRLQNYVGLAASMGDIFGQLYEMGGKKMKVFFYLQKAMSIAQITMQAAIAAMTALAPPPIGLGPLAGQGLAAAVWAIAAANIAIVVAQTLKGMWKGGPVTGGSGARDDVPAMLTRGEYVMTKQSADYYGPGVMEAIRRRVIPKDILQGFGFFPVARPEFAFAAGGMVTSGAGNVSNSVSIPIVINGVDANPRLVSRLREAIEPVVIRVLREHTR